jgi:hypothetical protein
MITSSSYNSLNNSTLSNLQPLGFWGHPTSSGNKELEKTIAVPIFSFLDSFSVCPRLAIAKEGLSVP